MTETKLDMAQIKADREAGTDGPWFSLPMQGGRKQTNFSRVFATDDDLRYIADCVDSMNFHSKTDNEANARRIARVPDLEAALIAQEAALQAADEVADAADRFEQMASHIHHALVSHHDTQPDGFNEMWHKTSQALAAYRTARKDK